jgi:hypothetical protein
MSPPAFEYVDLILRHVPCLGWFYILATDGTEAARGEFKPTAAAALDAGMAMAGRLWRLEE